MAKKKGMTPRGEDYPQWYQEVIKGAELAQPALDVKGCMIIRPYGYAIWEAIQRQLDEMIKETGHVNAYFPMFIPESYINKEKDHVEGFAPECAVVTHAGGKELEEKLYIRPTSETIIGKSYSEWVQSYRDLPILINQWANVCRWEKRTRLFLRTSEFLWQEGHTAHETSEEGRVETEKMLGVYRRFAEDVLALPVITGEKTKNERFAGADHTYSIEAMMQDRKALQAGTSHNLGQNFAKAFDIKYLSREQTMNFAWTTSWGVSTRLIGALIMAHSDDKGLVVPPRVAPIHVVIIPISKKPEEMEKIRAFVQPVIDGLKGQRLGELKLRVKFDDRDAIRPGPKFYEWERKGVPLRLEVGMRDVAAGHMVFVRRDTNEKSTISPESFVEQALPMLESIQQALFDRALAFREENTRRIDDKAEFEAWFTPKNKGKPEIHGGFAYSHFCGEESCELGLKALKLTIRCVPDQEEPEDGLCIRCGGASRRRVIYAKAY